MDALRNPSRRMTVAALLAIFAVAAAAGLLIPVPADAVPAHGTHVDYYDSATYCNQVGYEYYDCNGVLQSWWGVTSPYSQSATYGCVIEP